MKNPPHPGKGLRYDIKAMAWTVAECARRLGLSHATLSRVLNGKQRVTPTIALSLERLGWSDATTWMRLQTTYDLAQGPTRAPHYAELQKNRQPVPTRFARRHSTTAS